MKLEDIPAAIVGDMTKYTEDVSKKVDKAVRKRTQQMKNDIVAKSPIKTGVYKKSWIKYISARKGDRTQGYVRNKEKPKIVQPLERGHYFEHNFQKWVEGIKHVDPAEDKARADLAKDIEKILEE